MILIAADGKNCLSGFHAANLAAIFAAKGLHVSLFERSALLPNAGYFLSLPPGRYLPSMNIEGGLRAGIAGIRTDCSAGGCTPADDDGDRPRVDLIHLPPVYPVKPFRSILHAARVFADDITVFLMLRTLPTPVAKFAGIVEDELGPAAACVLDLGDVVPPPSPDETGIFNLGRMTAWMDGLGDRVPVVLRDPDSPPSREFTSVADTLLFKINQLRRNAGASRTSGLSDGLQSG